MIYTCTLYNAQRAVVRAHRTHTHTRSLSLSHTLTLSLSQGAVARARQNYFLRVRRGRGGPRQRHGRPRLVKKKSQKYFLKSDNTAYLPGH